LVYTVGLCSGTDDKVIIIVQHSIVERCSGQLTGPADCFLSHWDHYAVLNLEVFALGNMVYIVTLCSGSGGIEAHLSGQLPSFGALMLLVRTLSLYLLSPSGF